MNFSDLGLIIGFIASLSLTVMPKIQDSDVLITNDISLQRKRKNFRTRAFYRSMVGTFSVGFLMQYIDSAITGSKTIGNIIVELFVCVGIVVVLAGVIYGSAVFMNRQVKMRIRYVPQYPSDTQYPEGVAICQKSHF